MPEQHGNRCRHQPHRGQLHILTRVGCRFCRNGFPRGRAALPAGSCSRLFREATDETAFRQNLLLPDLKSGVVLNQWDIPFSQSVPRTCVNSEQPDVRFVAPASGSAVTKRERSYRFRWAPELQGGSVRSAAKAAAPFHCAPAVQNLAELGGPAFTGPTPVSPR